MLSTSRIKLSLFFVLLIFCIDVHAESCCGAISIKGRALESVYDKSQVEKLWLNGHHVDWQTGLIDKPDTYKGPDTHSHCSSFTAAIGQKLGVYLLRPPEAPQTFLATAQAHWLNSSKGQSVGWTKLKDMKEAQSMANDGEFVIAVYASPKKFKPGHIAIVRPAEITIEELLRDGPKEIQAGKLNYNSTSVRIGFENHKSVFPTLIQYFAHSISISTN